MNAWFQYFPQNPGWSFQVLRVTNHIWSGGADLSEMHRALSSMREGDPESWYTHWLGLADKVAFMAREAVEAGHQVSAREHFFRAANYYRIAEFFLAGDDPRKAATYKKCVEAFEEAVLRLRPPLTRLEIPYEGMQLPGYLMPPEGPSSPPWPTVVYIGGADSTKEEHYFSYARAIVQRGMACLVWDAPGQGESIRFHGLGARADFEVPLKAVLGFLEGRPEVDRDRIAVLGSSMGGILRS